MAITTMVHVRVDEQIKTQAAETLAAMGLTVSDAVRVFLTLVVAEKQLPFALKVPNTDTRAAMAEVDEIIRKRQARFGLLQSCSMTLKKTAASKRASLPRAVEQKGVTPNLIAAYHLSGTKDQTVMADYFTIRRSAIGIFFMNKMGLETWR